MPLFCGDALEILHRFFNTLTDGHGGIEGQAGVLEDHLQLASASVYTSAVLPVQQIDAIHDDPPAVRGFQSGNQVCYGALAAAALADQAHAFAAAQLKAHVPDRFDPLPVLGKGLAQMLHIQYRVAHAVASSNTQWVGESCTFTAFSASRPS